MTASASDVLLTRKPSHKGWFGTLGVLGGQDKVDSLTSFQFVSFSELAAADTIGTDKYMQQLLAMDWDNFLMQVLLLLMQCKGCVNRGGETAAASLAAAGYMTLVRVTRLSEPEVWQRLTAQKEQDLKRGAFVRELVGFVQAAYRQGSPDRARSAADGERIHTLSQQLADATREVQTLRSADKDMEQTLATVQDYQRLLTEARMERDTLRVSNDLLRRTNQMLQGQ
jgi:hypothetical protein